MKLLLRLAILTFLFFFSVQTAFAQVKIETKVNGKTQVYTTRNVTITGEHIESFDSNIVVNKDGTIDVKETILYDFSTLQRHGIFRNIPYTKISPQNKTLEMLITDFSVKDELGNNYNFVQTNTNDRIQLKIGDADKLITGLHTYIISYRASGEIGYFDTYDELFWNVTGNEWEVPIAKATATISLPEGVRQGDINAKCFTGAYGSKEEKCSINVVGNTVSFASNDNIPGQNEPEIHGLTILAGFPKGFVATLLPSEKVNFFDTPFGKIVGFLIGVAFVIWYTLLPLSFAVLWYFRGRDPNVGKPATAWYDPPVTKSGRSLSPAETGALVDEKVESKDVFSTIINLAQRGYLVIQEKEKKDFTLLKQKEFKNDSSLLEFEKTLLQGIFAEGKTCHLKDTQIYKEVNEVKSKLYKDLVTEGFFPSNPQTIRTIWAVIAVLGIFTGNIVMGIAALIFGRSMPRKTLFGAQQANVGKALKNFLSSQERQLAFQSDKQMMFEKLLPYAVAFGVEKIWAKRFEEFKLQPPNWYHGYSGSTFNSALFASSLNSSYSSFNSASTPPSSSGSGFGGGGFSGGGGGGGGGGSW